MSRDETSHFSEIKQLEKRTTIFLPAAFEAYSWDCRAEPRNSGLFSATHFIHANGPSHSMLRSAVMLLQAVIVLVGIGVLALMLWEPHLEGRNAHATLFQIYFNDPFLAYAFVSSIAFFVALFQAFKFLGFIGRNEFFSHRSVTAVRTVKYCALILLGFLVGAEAFIIIFHSGKDDIAGGVAMGLMMIVASVIAAAAATVFERILQSAADLKYGASQALEERNNAPL